MEGICYVDFCSDAKRTACNSEPDYERVTIFLSGASCPGCIAAIQKRIERVKEHALSRAA